MALADTEPNITPNIAEDSPYPLAGLRVLDLSRVLSGPYVGRLLSDLGCDVVKVEGPEGDVARLWGEVRNGASGYYFQNNAGKRNVALDFKVSGAISIVHQLAARADIVVENFRAGVADRLGLGWDQLSTTNPALIMLSISGWGQTGLNPERRAFAPVIHAQSGLIDRQATVHDLPPTDPLLSIADYNAGLHGLIATLAALHLRRDTGLGQHIDIAMFDAMLATDCYAHHYLDGSDFQRLGGYIWAAPGGPVLLAADYRHTWLQISRTFHLKDPAPVGSDLNEKIRSRREEIARWMLRFEDRDSLLTALDHADLVHSDIVTSREAFTGQDARARGAVVEVGDGDGGPRSVIQSPYRFSGATSGARGPAPSYGAHNEVVLAEWLHLSQSEIDSLLRNGILLSKLRAADN